MTIMQNIIYLLCRDEYPEDIRFEIAEGIAQKKFDEKEIHDRLDAWRCLHSDGTPIKFEMEFIGGLEDVEKTHKRFLNQMLEAQVNRLRESLEGKSAEEIAAELAVVRKNLEEIERKYELALKFEAETTDTTKEELPSEDE